MEIRTVKRRTALGAVLALFLAAAALAGGNGKDQAALDADILRLSPKMASYLVQHVRRGQDPRARVYDLVDLLLGEKGLHLTYEKTGTKSAIETFNSRRGNCLSFTILYVAMARHLGLDAYFEEVSEVLNWDRRGDVVLRNQHMFVQVEILNGFVTVDFLPGVETRYRQVRRIHEPRVLAHYYNNLAVDLLAEGDAKGAVPLFQKALEKDSTFAPAWTNLGVAYRRLGDYEQAEESHRKGIEAEPGELTASANLASLYLFLGRNEEARPLLARVDEHLKKSPFHLFQLGMKSLREDDAAEAVRHFKEAVRRLPKEPEFHVALADAYLATGDTASARENLRRALELTDDEEKKAELARELAELAGRG